MKTFVMVAGLYVMTGGLALMGVQTLAEHPVQHSGTQRVSYLRAYQ